jgi:hypothetical protein
MGVSVPVGGPSPVAVGRLAGPQGSGDAASSRGDRREWGLRVAEAEAEAVLELLEPGRRHRAATAIAAIANTAVSAAQAAVKSGGGTGRTSDQALPDAWRSTQRRTLPPVPTYTQPKRMRAATSVRRKGRKEKVLCG